MNDELLRLEREGWDALTTDGAAEFYEKVLAPAALMLFPGMDVLDRPTILQAMRAAPPWRWYKLSEERVDLLADGTAAVTYLASAQRDGQAPYVARISSLYVEQDGGWKLAFHQHTPEPAPES